MANELPPLPDGFTLDTPPPPEGFTLDNQQEEVTAKAAPKTQSEAVLSNVKQRWNTFNDPRGAVLTIGSSMLAEPVAGLAGIAGAVSGGSDRGAEWVEATRNAMTIDPPNQASERVVGGVGRGVEAVMRGVRSIPAAMATSYDPEESFVSRQHERDYTREQREQIREQIKSDGFGDFLGEGARILGAPPSVSSAFEALPTAVAFALGWGASRLSKSQQATVNKVAEESGRRNINTDNVDQVRKVADEVSPQWKTQGDVSVVRPSLDKPVDITPRQKGQQQQAEGIASSLRRRKDKEAAAAVLPDESVQLSAERLGVTLNPEHYSTNAAFQDVSRALKSQPGSRLEAAERRAIDELSSRADDVVYNISGTLDKGSVSESVRSALRSTIDDIDVRANQSYGKVRDAIPAETRINPEAISVYLSSRLAELGGNKNLLNPVEKQLFHLTKRPGKPRSDTRVSPMLRPPKRRIEDQSKYPTYAALDRVRQNIGHGFRRRGPFKDVDSDTLGRVYGLLSDVQQGIADSFGVGELYSAGRSLVFRRKALEESSIQLFGKSLSDSMVPKIRSAATGLSSGDVGRFNRIMALVPAELRPSVAASVLSDIFSGGSRKGGQMGQGFSASWQALNRNQSAKNALFKHLPDEARQRFDDIGRVLTGIIRSNTKPMANPSGTAAAIVKALEDGGALSKLYDAGKQVGAAEGVSSTAGAPGLGSAFAIGKIWSQRRTPVMVAADELLSSPRFAQLVKEATPQAESVLSKSPEFQRWYRLMPDQQKKAIAATGFIEWLSQEQ